MTKILRILEWFLGGIILFLGLVALLGWIGDRTSTHDLNEFKDEILSIIKEFQRTEFNREVVLSERKKGNAWDEYSRAIEEIKEYTKEGKRLFLKIRGAENLFSSQVFSVIDSLQTALDNLAEGAKRSSCKIPYNYEKSMYSWNYSFWRTLAELGIVSGNRNLLQKKSKRAVHDYISTLCYSQDIGNGGLTLTGKMIGIYCSRKTLLNIIIGLNTDSFEKDELLLLTRSLHSLEKTLQTLSQSLMLESMACVYPEIGSLQQYICAFLSN